MLEGAEGEEAEDGGSCSCSSSNSGCDEAGAEQAGQPGASPLLLVRLKGESAEEKRARKASVKDARRASRTNKKELKSLFKSEAGKQRKRAGTMTAASTIAIA